MWQDHPGIDSQHHYPKCNVDVYVTFNLRLNAEGNLRVRFPKLSDSDTQIAESVLSQDGTLLDQRTPRIEMNAAGFPSNTIIPEHQRTHEDSCFILWSCVPGACKEGLLSLVPAVACGLRESFIIPEKPERNGHGVEVDESWLPLNSDDSQLKLSKS